MRYILESGDINCHLFCPANHQRNLYGKKYVDYSIALWQALMPDGRAFTALRAESTGRRLCSP
jgi:hypothetical protein